MIGRMFQWRVGVNWYVITLFLLPVLSLFALQLYVLLGNNTPVSANLDKWYLLPLVFVQVLLLGGPLQEEIGWRGYALPKLQAHQNALVSGIVVGLLWGLWHLPLFLIPYSSQYGIPVLGFVLIDVALGILFAWVYNNTGGSLLLSMCFHTSVNVTSWFLPIGPKASGSEMPIWLIAALLFVAAFLVTFAFGRERLSRKSWQIVDPFARQHQVRMKVKARARLTAKRISRFLGVVLERLLVLLVMVIAALPVLVLPIGTMVPAPVWGVLAIIDLMLVIWLFRSKWTLRAVGAAVAGALVVVLIATAASQLLASTPPIVDASGKPLPNSIATLEKVTLNGTEQWISIRGKNADNPVLLNLGMGGPGGGGFATRGFFERLEDRFVVVSWDEPGTGKSYGAVPIPTLTPQRFVDDAHALTLLLRERFHQDKVYLYGVSWTSILGIWLVQQYPDLYAAYVGNGQMVNTTENDVMGYQLALKYSSDKGDVAAAETLRRNGPPPYAGGDVTGKYLAYLDVLNDYMGSPRYAVIVPIVPVFAQEYGLVDKVNHTRGLVESFAVVYPQLRDLDFTTQAAKLEVPVYFLVGRYDVNAMASLVERYYNVLQAPHKELIWLEGGHGLDDENLDQFVDVMVNKVLAQNQPIR